MMGRQVDTAKSLVWERTQ